MNELNTHSILGVTTHVSAPNSSTCWTTALKKIPQHYLVCPFPDQYPIHPFSALLRLAQVSRHSWTIFVPRRQYSPQVLKTWHRLELFPVDLKGHLRAFPYLCLRQSPSLPLRPTPEHCGDLMSPIEGPPQYQNFAS